MLQYINVLLSCVFEPLLHGSLRQADLADIEMKETPLHLAIQRGHTEVIRVLMEKNVSIDAVDVKGNSVFHTAASSSEAIIKVSFASYGTHG